MCFKNYSNSFTTNFNIFNLIFESYYNLELETDYSDLIILFLINICLQ